MKIKSYRHPLVEQFMADMIASRQWGIGTQKIISNIVQSMLNYIKKYPADITSSDVAEYLKNKYNREYWTRYGTVGTGVSAIRTFFDYLYDKGVMQEKVNIKVVMPKKEAVYIDKSIFKKVRQQRKIIDSSRFSSRDKAIWYLLYTSTARKMDLPEIKRKDLDLDRGKIMLEEGRIKENRFPFIVLSDLAIMHIKRYLSKTKIRSEYIFINNLGKKLSMSAIDKTLKEVERLSRTRLKFHERQALMLKLAFESDIDFSVIKFFYGRKGISMLNEYSQASDRKLKPIYEMRKLYHGMHKHSLA